MIIIPEELIEHILSYNLYPANKSIKELISNNYILRYLHIIGNYFANSPLILPFAPNFHNNLKKCQTELIQNNKAKYYFGFNHRIIYKKINGKFKLNDAFKYIPKKISIPVNPEYQRLVINEWNDKTYRIFELSAIEVVNTDEYISKFSSKIDDTMVCKKINLYYGWDSRKDITESIGDGTGMIKEFPLNWYNTSYVYNINSTKPLMKHPIYFSGKI